MGESPGKVPNMDLLVVPFLWRHKGVTVSLSGMTVLMDYCQRGTVMQALVPRVFATILSLSG